MFKLEVRHLTGKQESISLEKTQPISIGAHPSNDLCIEEGGIGVLHCRVSWNRTAFEVVAASAEGIEVNGTVVRHALLKNGDVIRIGSLDLILREQRAKNSSAERFAEPSDSLPGEGSSDRDDDQDDEAPIGLKPISEQELPVWYRPQNTGSPSASPAPVSSSAPHQDSLPINDRGEADDVPEMIDDDPDNLGEAADSLDDESFDERDDHRVRTPPRELESLLGKLQRHPSKKEIPQSSKSTWRDRLRGRAVRPGEQDILQSPLVLGLGIFGVILLLIAATIWFVIGRETARRQYASAVAYFEEGKYNQAIRSFEEFLERFPRHAQAIEARVGLHEARIEREISGATPAWTRGTAALEDFLHQFRDHPDFSDHLTMVRRYAERIALGAAQAAEAGSDRSLLEVAREAERLLQRFAPSDGLSSALRSRLRNRFERAETAIVLREVFDEHRAEIESALDDADPERALNTRRRLLQRYPHLSGDPRLEELLDRALLVERDRCSREELDREAIRSDRESRLPVPLSLAVLTRSRTDETSEGRTVFAVAKDCCYGIDTVTGTPQWRRVIGLNTPFFPQPISTSREGILLFDTNFNELLLLEQQTGELIWRQPLEAPASGPPLIHAGSIYLTTSDRSLYKIEAETGRLTARLQFARELLSPPVLSPSKEQLIVAGSEDVLYELALRPLECEQVSYVGHGAQTVRAPLLPMGGLLLMCENDRNNSCQLRVLKPRAEDGLIETIFSERIAGHVWDPPVLRGKQLFVASSGQRLTAFTVTDDPGRQPLVRDAEHQLPSGYQGPMFLAAGPDGQVWLAGGALHRLQLKTDTFQLDPRQTASGIGSQPLQMIGSRLFLGRTPWYADAVLFSQIDRNEMTGRWRVVLGGSILCGPTWTGESGLVLTETGDLYRLGRGDLEQGGFALTATGQLALPSSLREPLRAAAWEDGRISVDCGGETPRWWIVGPNGQLERRIDLEQPLQHRPVPFGNKLVLPFPGHLRIVETSGSPTSVEDYLLPRNPNDAPTRWTQILALNDRHLLAVTDHRRLSQLQYRTMPVPHLAEVAHLDLDEPARQPICLRGDQLFVADASPQLRVLNASTLDPVAEHPLDAPVSSDLWIVDDRLYFATGQDTLHCFEWEPALNPVWTQPLTQNVALAGTPVHRGSETVLVDRQGNVSVVDRDDGRLVRQFSVNQPVTGGFIRFDDLLLVPSLDGSLHRVESIFPEIP